MNSIVGEKSENFAVRIVNLCNYLKKEKHENVISRQLLKSGTSVGANINEALNGFSRKDFLAKMYVSFKECRETQFWLKLLYRTGYLNEKEYRSIDADCTELLRILTGITRTTSQSINDEKRTANS